MPLLSAIDIYDSSNRQIAAHAQTALLSTEPASQEAALRYIFKLCEETDENVEGVLSGPLATALTLRWLKAALF